MQVDYPLSSFSVPVPLLLNPCDALEVRKIDVDVDDMPTKSPTSARERDLLAIIAEQDKTIRQLENKLDKNAEFIDSLLQMSCNPVEPKKPESPTTQKRQKPRRRVSWCPSVDDQLKRSDHSRRSSVDITVDDILDEIDDDDCSFLSDSYDDEDDQTSEASQSEPGPRQQAESTMCKEEQNKKDAPPVRLKIVGVGSGPPRSTPRRPSAAKKTEPKKSALVQAILAGMEEDRNTISL